MTRHELELQNAELAAQVERLNALLAAKSSKSKKQGEAAVAMLQEKGTVTLEDLKSLNEKYPSDPIYFARTLCGVAEGQIKTNRKKGQPTTYTWVVEQPQAPAQPEAVVEQEAAVAA